MTRKSKRTTKKKVVIKPRNAGTMTESAFWSFIRSALRQKSRWWKPITQCKMKSRRAYKGPNKRQKFEYQCNECKLWFPDKKINVDHVIPAGTLRCANDLPGFVERLFCEIDNLQVLCSGCHDVKTKNEKDGR
jgi:5-methylcytosine-specific restriction endonuclease McrA